MNFSFLLTLLLSGASNSFANEYSTLSHGNCDDSYDKAMDNILDLIEHYDDVEITTSMCNSIERKHLLEEVESLQDSSDPCMRKAYKVAKTAHADVFNNLLSGKGCHNEMRKELEIAHSLLDNNRRQLIASHDPHRKLVFWFALAIPKLIALAVYGTANVVKDNKRRRLDDREGINEMFDVNTEQFIVPAEMNQCNTTEYDISVIITPGPHAVIGAKPAETTDDCPTLVFESSNYNRERKSMLLVEEGSDWGNLKEDSMFSLGTAQLQDVFSAFEAVDVLQQNEFHVETNNCFHFSQSMWRHLDLPESEDLLNFLVEEVVKDENTLRMLNGKGSTDHSRNVLDKETLKKYIYEVAASQIDFAKNRN